MHLVPAIAITASLAVAGAAPVSPPRGAVPWPMFQHDPAHTGVADVRVPASWRPAVRWRYRIAPPADVAATDDAAPVGYRWTSGLPVGDVNGDGRPEVVATTPDGVDGPDRVVVLADAPGTPDGVRALWSYSAPTTYPAMDVRKGHDTYSPVLVDVDGDALPDVVFTTKDGFVRALKGTNGAVVWEYPLGRRTEAGPMLGDLDGDGRPEIVVVTDCRSLASTSCPEAGDRARLVVLPTAPTAGRAPVPVWTLEYPYKMDSAMPAFAPAVPGDKRRKAVVVGTWGGELLVAWQRPNGEVATSRLALSALDPDATRGSTPVIRSSPLVVDWGDGPTIVFGWLPTDLRAGYGRLSAVRAEADPKTGQVRLRAAWTISELDTWKSSPALLAGGPGRRPLVVVGYGLAAPRDGQSDTVGRCQQRFVFGGVAAVDRSGRITWRRDLPGEGNIRASVAVARSSAAGSLVVVPVGCYGAVYGFDQTGKQLWRLQLGPRSQGSPSIVDLDRDGRAEILLTSYDGNVWALSDAAVIGRRVPDDTPATAPPTTHAAAVHGASPHPTVGAHRTG